jgi:hypothetical protein
MRPKKKYTNVEIVKFADMKTALLLAGLITPAENEKIKSRITKLI